MPILKLGAILMKKGAETIIIVGLLVIAGLLGFVTFESKIVNAVTYNVGSGVGNDVASARAKKAAT